MKIQIDKCSINFFDDGSILIQKNNEYLCFDFSEVSRLFKEATRYKTGPKIDQSHHAFRSIFNLKRGSKDTLDFNITIREKQVLQWIVKGKTNWEISVILGISERTTKFHVTNILKKLDAATRSQAAATALISGIIF